MKQKCIINDFDYCEHDNNSIVVISRGEEAECCEKHVDMYEEEVDICPVCGFRLERLKRTDIRNGEAKV